MENENNISGIQISDDAINTIVTTACKEVEGVVGIHQELESSIKNMFNKKKVLKGVEHEFVGQNKITIDAAITVEYGYELTPVGIKVQEKIKEAIENMTSYEVEKVNVKVANVKEISKEK
ncbi:MAG: Asp23/Gls24 family envelope stress response protein [Clostridia bacterium]|nr:Asp23/Gls24 family envelope stress response protein [Clostridia bacterium]